MYRFGNFFEGIALSLVGYYSIPRANNNLIHEKNNSICIVADITFLLL